MKSQLGAESARLQSHLIKATPMLLGAVRGESMQLNGRAGYVS